MKIFKYKITYYDSAEEKTSLVFSEVSSSEDLLKQFLKGFSHPSDIVILNIKLINLKDVFL